MAPRVKVETQAPLHAVHESLSDRIRKETNRIEYEEDDYGRVIGVRKLHFLDFHRITLAMGEHAKNETALAQAAATASVVSIDGELVAMPTSHMQIEALMQRLDMHGIGAASRAAMRFNEEGGINEEAVKN